MKSGSPVFLQFVLVLVGIGTLAFLLWEPHLEGRNKNATLFEIYFNDPLLAYAYVASIPFFVTLYQAFNVLRFARQDRTFSQEAVKAMRVIKFCGIAIIGFVAVGEIAFVATHHDDDRPVGIVMGILITFVAIVITTAATMFERIIQNAVDIKSENDLTV